MIGSLAKGVYGKACPDRHVAPYKNAHAFLSLPPSGHGPRRIAQARLARLEYREELVSGYAMLYRIEGDAIVAKRLFHATQDYESCV